MEHKSCPLCREVNVISRVDYGKDWTTRFGDTIEADQCPTCGLVYLNPYDDPDQTRAYYEDGLYRDDVSWDRGKPFDWTQHRFEQAEYAHQLFYWIAQQMDYEVPGKFAHVGADPEDVDPVADMFGYLFPDSEFKPQSVSDLASWKPVEKVDLICCCQTIDHLVNPREALSQMVTQLNAGGYLYVDFVDFDQTRQLKWDHPSNFNRLSAIYAMREVVGGELVMPGQTPTGA